MWTLLMGGPDESPEERDVAAKRLDEGDGLGGDVVVVVGRG